MNLERTAAVALLVTAAACGGSPPNPPFTRTSCPDAPPGQGAPSVEMGNGVDSHVPRVDGQSWDAEVGPQGGQHAWLSIRATGLRPRVIIRYQFGPLDGGAFHAWNETTACMHAKGDALEAAGLYAQMLLGPTYCSPEVCSAEPYLLRVKLVDQDGVTAEDARVVGGVVLRMNGTVVDNPCEVPDAGAVDCTVFLAREVPDAGPF